MFTYKSTDHLFQKGNYAVTYSEIPIKNPRNAWRDGMISGNGENGYITSGAPYSDTFIFQNMWFNFPSGDPREIPEELPGQLEEARKHVFEMDDSWIITDSTGKRRHRPFYYSYHPGHQLRLEFVAKGNITSFERWTNYETAETGVAYTDEQGQWQRVSFTSRTDNVTITKITQSSTGTKINMVVSIDDILAMAKSHNGMSEVEALQYKKIVDLAADYIAQVVKYPSYQDSELENGGYAGLTKIIVVNGSKQRIVLPATSESMNVGDDANPAIQITDADAVYLITKSSRTFNMSTMSAFAELKEYSIVDQLLNDISTVVERYQHVNGHFDYDKALASHSRLHGAEFSAVSLSIDGDDEYKQADNETLINIQKASPDRINKAFLEQVYNQGRYAMVCCSGSSAPRLYGMWTGEWNPGWRGIYTLDANVNLQVAAMNTGHLTLAQLGYITFFLRNTPDFEYNARMAYGMHDALQVSVNSDGDRGMHIEYDNDYPFQYWNAGASWCLLPIYEFWQCYGNQQIPIVDEMRIENLQHILSVRDGGLSDAEFVSLQAQGYLDFERDILLPLLTKQANFWEQICTPEYYIDVEGKASYERGKKTLLPGERYMIIPAYSPENHPIGYSSTITANATMDISAARDGLQMVINVEQAVKRPGYEAAIEKWNSLLQLLPEYQYDLDGALREWSMNDYIENNDHRHLSHLYVAWPAYETEKDERLALAAKKAIINRDHYNTNDATAGHGWMHKALVYSRLKDGEGVVQSLLPMMSMDGYYPSLMTDHDTNRRNNCYCTDTLFGTVAAINEALLFSNTGVVELLPALSPDWRRGTVNGLMARSWLEVHSLSWDLALGLVRVVLKALRDDNEIKLKLGLPWVSVTVDDVEINHGEVQTKQEITLNLMSGKNVEIKFHIA